MLAKQLQKLLTERNLSVAELARQSGVAKTNLHLWLTGGNPNASQLVKVAKSLGVTTDFLLTGEKQDEEDLSKIFSSVEMHTGHYEISIKRLVKK